MCVWNASRMISKTTVKQLDGSAGISKGHNYSFALIQTVKEN